MMRSATGHTLVPLHAVLDALRDRHEESEAVTVLDVLEAVRALGCERAGAMAERERRRPQR